MFKKFIAAFVFTAFLSAAPGRAALVDHWTLEEGTGTVTADVIDGDDATFVGAPVWNAVIPTAGATSTHCVGFNLGNGHLLSTNNKGITGTNARTVSAWIRTRSQAAGQDLSIMSWGANVAGQKWNFRVQQGNGTPGAIRVEVNGGFVVGSTVVTDGQWHHVACTFEDDGSPNVTDVRLYVDGQLEATSATQSQALNTASGNDVLIGQDFSSREFNGWMDDVRLYDEALDAAAIAALAAETLPLLNTTLNHDADNETAATAAIWESAPDVPLNEWDFSAAFPANINLVEPAGSALPGIANAYSFDGTAGAQNRGLNDLPTDPSDGDASWEFWFKPDAGADVDRLFETGGGGDGMSVLYDGSANEIVYTVDDGAIQVQLRGGSGLLTDSEFHQVLCVYNRDAAGANDLVELYIDGRLVDSDSSQTLLNDWDGGDTATFMAIGTSVAGTTPANTNFEGQVAKFRFYEQVLGPAEAQAAFFSVAPLTPLNHWVAEEGTGTTTTDIVNGVVANFTGNPTWSSSIAFPGSSATATRVIQFDGNDQLDVPGYKAPAIGGGASRTISAWIRTRDAIPTQNRTILSYGQPGTTGERFTFRIQADNGTPGTIRVEVEGGAIVGSTVVTDGQWHHVACTLFDDGSPTVNEIQLYVDGQLETPSFDSGAIAINTDTGVDGLDLRIGNDHGTRQWFGWLDDVRLYDFALTPTDLAQIASENEIILNATLNHDADTETTGTGQVWNNLEGLTGHDWDFGGNFGSTVVLAEPVVSALPGIVNAYTFSGGGATNQGLDNLGSNPSDADASWEIWFRPAADGDVDRLFETGGSGDGMSIQYDGANNEVVATLDDGAVQVQLRGGAGLIDTTEFHQIFLVYNRDASGTNDRVELFIDGKLVDSDESATALNDWDGGDTANLASVGTGLAATSLPDTVFEGDIAKFRFYEQVVSQEQIALNYFTVALPELALKDGAAPTDPDIVSGSGVIDFGIAPAGVPVSRDFTLVSEGIGNACVYGVNLPAGFSHNLALPANIPAGSDLSFQITLNETALGSTGGTVSLDTNDNDENPFTFEVIGFIASTNVVINEVDADTPTVPTNDNMEFVELFGPPNTPLDGLALVTYNGSDDLSYNLGGHVNAIDLDGFSLDANGFFTIGNPGVNGVDLVFNANSLQNGADAVALYAAEGIDFPNDTPIDLGPGLIDAVVYETGDANDTGLAPLLVAGVQLDEDADNSSQRTPNGAGGKRDTTGFDIIPPTPDALNGLNLAHLGTLNADLVTIRLNPAGDTIECVDGNNIVIASTPLADTVSITVDLLDGNDTLTVDFINGDPIPTLGLAYNGGADIDTLVVNSGAFGFGVHTMTGTSDGNLDLDGSVLTYSSLEPVNISGSTFADLTLVLPPGPDTALLLPLGGDLFIFDGPSFESTTFSAPAPTSLNIVGGAGDLVNVDTGSFAGRLSLNVPTIDSADFTADSLVIGETTFAAEPSSSTLTANGETLTITTDLQLGGGPNTGANLRGNVTQSGGTVEVGGNLVFGGAAGREGGTYNLDGGILNVTGDIVETAGNVDAAQLHLDGGSLSVDGNITVQRFAIAQDFATSGAYTPPAGQAVVSTGTTSIGVNGSGTLNLINAGSSLQSNDAHIGETVDGVGEVNIAGGAAWSVNGELRIGTIGEGLLNVESGTVSAGAGIRLADNSLNSVGTLNIGLAGQGAADPIINSSGGNFETADAGDGTVVMDSGTLNQTSNNLIVGQTPTSSANFTLNDGLIDIQNQLRVGNDGSGIFTQNGGTLNVGTILDIANLANGDGQFFMNGGILNVGDRAASDLIIGNFDAGTTSAEMTINDGTVNISRGIKIANVGLGSSGLLTIGDGTSSPVVNLNTGAANNFETAVAGSGTFTFNSGTVTMNNSNFITGQNVGSVADVTMGGGATPAVLDLTGGNGERDWNTNSGFGTVTLSPNSMVLVGRNLNLSNSADPAAGINLTLSGGEIHLGANGVDAGNLDFRDNGDGLGTHDIVTINDGMLTSNGGVINLRDASEFEFAWFGGTLAGFSSYIGGTLNHGGGDLIIGPAVNSMSITGGDFISFGIGTLFIDLDGNAGAGVAGGNDLLDITNGFVDLGFGDLVLDVELNFPAAINDTFVILANDDTDAIGGTFNGLNEGDTLVTPEGHQFQISYAGGDGNDVELTLLALGTLAADDTVVRPANDNFVTIDAGFLLANDQGTGGTLSLSAIDDSGTRGTVTLSGSKIYYQPNGGDLASDSFEYTITETPGGTTSTATVTIDVDLTEIGQAADRAVNLGGTNFEVFFTGVPGTDYVIQFSPDMVAWSDIGNVTSDPINGRYSIIHDPGVSTGFFRSVFRP